MSQTTERFLNFKKKEALFRKTVRAAHQLFCNCEDPVQHLLGWRTTIPGEGIVGTVDTSQEHAEPGDAELLEELIDAGIRAGG
ncbi:hypothetical protein QKK92_gp1 [Mosquito VEM Anellovirus SDRB A]|uniref:Hepatitis TT virus Orf2/Gyrovirus Vp2 N-terminal domain-containing protein n=1 Tax=Mosquito VEM Anellovirus SDRB A TaxID=1034792 RepID=F6KID4_9VIRU|nr:hypothetical protein QKK92_gp1 [Mosquito VEM Anellovirus SDRB A]AEF58765.1 hypothetical protein [Mosquito VEM Anellovirus SDRB A]